MKTTIFLLVAIFLSNIALASPGSSSCPYKNGSMLRTKKPTANRNRLLPSTITLAQAQKPAKGVDSKN